MNILLKFIFFFLINSMLISNNCFQEISKLKNIYDILLKGSYKLTHCLKYQYCKNCIEKGEESNKNCKDCPAEIILRGFKVKSPDETLDELINKNKLIARFGDGEIGIIFGNDIYFQESNEELRKRLKEVLQSNEEGLIIGIFNALNIEYINKYVDFAKIHWEIYINNNKFKLSKLLNKSKEYCSTQFTRFYIDYKDKSFVPQY